MKYLPAVLIFIFCISISTFAQDFDLLADKVIAKDLNGLTELIENGIDINARQESTGATVLMLSCSYPGYEDVTEYLILNGADVNAVDSKGKTALIWAAGNSLESTRLLIANDADVKAKANDGMTAFLQSVFGILSKKITSDVCDVLISNGANVNATLNSPEAAGWGSLHFAVFEGDIQLVQYLIRHGAYVNHISDEGSSLLYLASEQGFGEIVTILQRAGAIE